MVCQPLPLCDTYGTKPKQRPTWQRASGKSTVRGWDWTPSRPRRMRCEPSGTPSRPKSDTRPAKSLRVSTRGVVRIDPHAQVSLVVFRGIHHRCLYPLSAHPLAADPPRVSELHHRATQIPGIRPKSRQPRTKNLSETHCSNERARATGSRRWRNTSAKKKVWSRPSNLPPDRTPMLARSWIPLTAARQAVNLGHSCPAFPPSPRSDVRTLPANEPDTPPPPPLTSSSQAACLYCMLSISRNIPLPRSLCTLLHMVTLCIVCFVARQQHCMYTFACM